MVAETAGREDSARVLVPPPLIYLSGLLLGWVLERLSPTPDLPRPWAVVVAVLLAVLSGFLDFGALGRFRRSRTPAEPWRPSRALVVEGPYRFTRNPMYLGMALLYAAIAVGFGWLWALALLVVVLVVIDRAVIGREERYLERRFGADYLAYKEQVRRWL